MDGYSSMGTIMHKEFYKMNKSFEEINKNLRAINLQLETIANAVGTRQPQKPECDSLGHFSNEDGTEIGK